MTHARGLRRAGSLAVPVVPIPSTATAHEAALRLLSGGSLHPVVDEQSRLLGVLDQHDLLAAAAARADWRNVAVTALMRTDPLWVVDTAIVEWILLEMAETRSQIVPVVDDAHRVVGMVSLASLAGLVMPDLFVEACTAVVGGDTGRSHLSPL